MPGSSRTQFRRTAPWSTPCGDPRPSATCPLLSACLTTALVFSLGLETQPVELEQTYTSRVQKRPGGARSASGLPKGTLSPFAPGRPGVEAPKSMRPYGTAGTKSTRWRLVEETVRIVGQRSVATPGSCPDRSERRWSEPLLGGDGLTWWCREHAPQASELQRLQRHT